MNPFVEFFGSGNLKRQGTAMDGFKHRYLDTGRIPRVVERTNLRLTPVRIGNAPSLRYSSPWPWALALGISLPMWAGLVWLVRLYV
jgi:hypothetical protein